MNAAAITLPDLGLHVLALQSRGGIVHQICFAPRDLSFLPVVNRHCLGGRRKIVPKVFDKLQRFSRAQVKNRQNTWVTSGSSGCQVAGQDFPSTMSAIRAKRRWPGPTLMAGLA